MLLELLWWIGWVWCAAWVALPLLALPWLGPAVTVVVWALMAPWSALLGMAAVHRLLPRGETGTFRLPGDRGAVRWALAGWAPGTYLTLFQPLFFASRRFQRLALRAFGAELGADAWITSRTIVREPHHVRIGARTLVGEYAHLACSLQPRPGLLLVGRIVIGDDCLVGAHSRLTAGVTIGSRCVLEHGVALAPRVTVGDGSRIGAGTTIYSGVRIGRGVTVGKNCCIAAGAVIPDGSRIPDFTMRAGAEAPRALRAVR